MDVQIRLTLKNFHWPITWAPRNQRKEKTNNTDLLKTNANHYRIFARFGAVIYTLLRLHCIVALYTMHNNTSVYSVSIRNISRMFVINFQNSC